MESQVDRMQRIDREFRDWAARLSSEEVRTYDRLHHEPQGIPAKNVGMSKRGAQAWASFRRDQAGSILNSAPSSSSVSR
jgi:hypothetical protein